MHCKHHLISDALSLFFFYTILAVIFNAVKTRNYNNYNNISDCLPAKNAVKAFTRANMFPQGEQGTGYVTIIAKML